MIRGNRSPVIGDPVRVSRSGVPGVVKSSGRDSWRRGDRLTVGPWAILPDVVPVIDGSG